jgi:hypothetical protein
MPLLRDAVRSDGGGDPAHKQALLLDTWPSAPPGMGMEPITIMERVSCRCAILDKGRSAASAGG